MADIKEQAEWPEGVYLIEKTDPVEGGEDGVDNKQAKALANRTQYLKKALEDSNRAAASQIELEKTYVDSLQTKRRLFEVSGTENDIILTSKASVTQVTELNDFDEFSFIVAATNTDVVTINIDDFGAIPVAGVTGRQIYVTALLTVRYVDGVFYIASQINPATGNNVDGIWAISPRVSDALQFGQYELNGDSLSRADHPIAWEIARASSNFVDQATKDSDPETYKGFFGDGDGVTTFTRPMLGGEFLRMYTQNQNIDDERVFGSHQAATQISQVLRTTGWGNGAWSDEVLGGVNNENYHSPNINNGGHSALLNSDKTITAVVRWDARPRNLTAYAITNL